MAPETWQTALAELLSAGAEVLRELATQMREENERARQRPAQGRAMR